MVLIVALAAVLLTTGTGKQDAVPTKPPIIPMAALKPNGTRYRATVPDTLDLAERARLAVHGLTSFTNNDANCAPYGHIFYDANPPYLGDLRAGPPNWGKISESLLFTRLMSGSEENLDIEARTLQGMMAEPARVSPAGDYLWSPDHMRINPDAPPPLSRAMLAMMVLDQTAPDAELRRWIDAKADDHLRAVKTHDGSFYYADPPPYRNQSRSGTVNYFDQVYDNGIVARFLARWALLHGDARYLTAAHKLADFAMQDTFWTGEGDPKAVVGIDRGHFNGHIHTYTQCLMGLLCYAEAAHDVRVEEFVRSSYEYIRNFGIARIGLFGEACSTGDMTYIALKLSDLGVGDYWDDADQYVRNELAELQITDATKLRRATDQMPAGRGMFDAVKGPVGLAPLESTDRIPERVVGTFFSDATHPTQLPRNGMLSTICCTGNCTPALYFAWESIVRSSGDKVQVNLLLNRASQWVDVDSYLPYEGKVVLHNKMARSLSVRMPNWVTKAAVRCQIDGKTFEPIWAGRYAVFANIPHHATVTITFPVTETTEVLHLKWRQSDAFFECTDPGKTWPGGDSPKRYVCTFRGNTLVEISPRDLGIGYPLYQRDEMKRTKAPMRCVDRFVPTKLAKW